MTSTRPRDQATFLGSLVLLMIMAAVLWWLIGFLPWALGGFSWSTAAATAAGSSSDGLAGVRLPLPLVAAYLPSLLCCSVIGGVLAGVLPLAFPRVSKPAVLTAVMVVVSVTVVITLLTTRAVIHSHAGTNFAADDRVVGGLVGVVVAATAVGLVAGFAAYLHRGLVPLTAAVAAVAFPSWLSSFLNEGSYSTGLVRAVDRAGPIVAGLLLLAGLALSVRHSWWPLVGWPVAAAIAWVGPSVVIGAGYLSVNLRPSSGLPDTFSDMVRGSAEAFRDSLGPSFRTWWPLLVAFVLAIAWGVGQQAMRSREDR
ncbi:MAG: hypothetical protein JWR35_1552 [Marmoricola sp.]|nr:hypothetical protein [Marmoricola sp.]